MKCLWLILSAFLILVPPQAQAVNTKAWLGTTSGKGSRIGASGLKLLPSTVPTHNDLSNGVIYYKLATHQILGYIDGSWVDMGVSVAGALTLDDVFDNGKIIDGATDSNNAMQVGDGTDAITFYLNAANDVRIGSTSGSDISIAPVGGDTSIVGTLDVSGSVTMVDITTSGDLTIAGDVDITVADTTANGVFIDGSTVTTGDVLQVEYDAGTLNAGLALNVTEDMATVFQIAEDGNTTVAGTAAGTASLTLTAGDLVLSSGRADINGDGSSADLLDITRSDSTTAGDAIDINLGSATVAGDGVDIAWTGAGTGDGIVVNLTNNLAGNALDLTGAGVRTAPIINVVSNGTDGGTDDNVIRVIQNGALDSPIVFIGYTTANSPGNAISIDMNTNLAGEGLFIDEGGTARTGSAIEVNADGTGTHSVIDLNVSANAAITALDITGSFTGSPAGDAIKITLDDADNLDTGLINFSVGTGARSALIKYVSTGTDSGTTSHVIDINQTGVLDSNVIDITYDTGASTGQAIDLNMGTNVAGMAIAIDSAATGVSDEGSGIDIDATGALVQGANVLRIDSAGNMAHADTRIVEISEAGANQASSYTMAISSTNNGGLIISSGATDNAISVTQGLAAFADDVTIATAKALNIGTQQVIAEDNVEGVNARRVARALFTYTDQSGSGTHDTGITVPDNAVITGFGYDVTTTFGGDGDDSSTIAVQVEGADDMVAAVAIQTGTPWDSGLHEGIPQPNDATTWVKTTAAKNISVVVAIIASDTALDAGAMVIWVEYIVTQ